MKRLFVVMLSVILLVTLVQPVWASNPNGSTISEKQNKWINAATSSTDEFIQVQEDLSSRDNQYSPIIVEVNQATKQMRIKLKIAAELSLYSADPNLAKDKQKPLIKKNLSAGEWITTDLPTENTPHRLNVTDKKNSMFYSVVVNNVVDEYGPDFYLGNVQAMKLEKDVAKKAAEANQPSTDVMSLAGTGVQLTNGANYYDSITVSGGSKYYYFVAQSSGTANVFLDVSNLPTTVDYDLQVTMPDGSVKTSQLGKGENELLTINIVQGSTYSIRVYSYSGSSTNQYVIRYREYPLSPLSRPVTTSSRVTYFFDISRGAYGNYPNPTYDDPGETWWHLVTATRCYWTHEGTDYGGGGNAATAALAGTVKDWYEGSGWDDRGQFVELEHPDGRITRYLHLESLSLSGIYKGMPVAQGEKVGVTGTTGRSSGEHLHFDIADTSGQRQCPYFMGWLPAEY